MAATNWFRKNQKKLLGILVVFLMVIWGIGPAADLIVPKPPIGTILGEKVSQEKFNDTVVRWARVFLRDSKQPVAELVWGQMAIIYQAQRMGIFVTNEELAQEIQKWFPVNQLKGRDGYRRMLGTAFHLTEHQFEKTLREYLLAQKFRYLLGNSVKITKDETFQRYSKENEKIKIKYIALNAKNFVDNVEIEEDKIRSFFDKHKSNFPNDEEGIWGYKEPEKVKIEYIVARNDVIGKQINISDESMLEYYENKKGLMFKKEDTPENTEKQGDEKGDEASTSEYKPFEVVKEQIKNTLLFKETDALANKLIGDADNDIYENIDEGGFLDFSKLAEKYSLSYVVPTNLNNGTNYFARDELIVIALGVPQFPQLVFDREINDPSTPLSSIEGKLIFRVLEKIDPRIPSYEEVYDKVKEDFRHEEAFRKAESLAEKCLEKIKQTSFDEGVKYIEEETGKIQEIETDYFSRPGIFSEDNYVKVLGMDRPELAGAGFNIKVGKSAIAIESKGEKMCFVVMLVDRKKADPKKFEDEKDSITVNYLTEKQLALLSEWESWIQTKTQLGRTKS